MSSESDILCEYITPQLAQVTLNIPDKHNSLNDEQLQQALSLINDLSNNAELRCLILTGAGHKTFCAGASFIKVADKSLHGAAFSGLAEQIYRLPFPTICALNGSVYGGGVELALACDFRIGVIDSVLSVPIAKIGLCYSEFGLQRYLAILGESVSKRILLLAEQLGAEQLLQLGFYDHIVGAEQLPAKAKQIAQQLSQHAPLALKAMKSAIQQLNHKHINPQAFDNLNQMCLQSADLQEGFSALLEKRNPIFNAK